jgi:hypothetical protein
MNATRYALQVQAKNMRVEIRINDVPVALFAPEEAATPAEVPINEFLLSGRNVATAIIHAHPRPSLVYEVWSPEQDRKVRQGEPASLQLKLSAQSISGAPVRDAASLQLNWTGLAAPLPQALDKAFEVAGPVPKWAWTRANVLPAPEVLETAFRALQQLHALLARKELAAFEKLLELKFSELTEGAYGVPAGPLRAGFVKGLSRCMQDPDWLLLPCERPDVDLRLVADGRMVECLRPTGHHALIYEKSGTEESFFLPTMLGHVDGSWQILR